MNWEKRLCDAIDLIAADKEHEAELALEQLVAEIKTALPDADKPAELHFAWGQALEIMQEAEQACLRYEKALEADPDHMPSWEATCNVLLHDLERPAEALSILQARLLPSDHENPQYKEWADRAEISMRSQTPPPDVEE
jgi:tetratricopeptide (TPR) repeat protein